MEETTTLIVGMNPSEKSPTLEAFDASTRSGRTLRGWIEGYESEAVFANLYNKPTPNNRPLNKTETAEGVQNLAKKIEELKVHKVVALGSKVSEVLTKMGVEHYKMPHPSGRSRACNDKAWLAEKVSGLREYISSPLTVRS